MEHRLFTTPQYHDADFYREIEHAPHWTQPGHGERLRMTLCEIMKVLLTNPGIQTIADWGCGDGALLHHIKLIFPNRHVWGYDLLPANVAHAKEFYRFDTAIAYKDFVNEIASSGHLTILTEVLEHLIDPHGLLRRLYNDPVCKWIVASSPANETLEAHYPHHNWVWDGDGFLDLFEGQGWEVQSRREYAGAQIVVARKP